jgi:hypothetical protein
MRNPSPPSDGGEGSNGFSERILDACGNVSTNPNRDSKSSQAPALIAVLIPPVRRTGVPYTGTYSLEFRGDCILDGSRNPECDLARVLVGRGITGTVKVIDAVTGKHRTTVNIEKAARLCVKEGPLRFSPYESRPEPSPEAEDGEDGGP